MKRYRKYEHKRLGDRFEVRGYIPPAKMVEIAADRTAGMMGAYLWNGARAHDLGILVRSCYMQGVNDAADALALLERNAQIRRGSGADGNSLGEG